MTRYVTYGTQTAIMVLGRGSTGYVGLGVLSFAFSTSWLRAEDGAVLLTVEGAPEDLDRRESVVGKHLVRSGAKDELVVEWIRDTGEPGTVWRNETE